jgi:hypothetical protein
VFGVLCHDAKMICIKGAVWLKWLWHHVFVTIHAAFVFCYASGLRYVRRLPLMPLSKPSVRISS